MQRHEVTAWRSPEARAFANKILQRADLRRKEAKREQLKMAAAADYDKDNIFAKIIRGEIPSYKVFESEHCIAIL